jgi:hypothetical protein
VEINRLKSDIEDLNEKLDVANTTKMGLLELKAESEDAIRKHKEAQSELNLMSDEISDCLQNLRNANIEYFEKKIGGIMGFGTSVQNTLTYESAKTIDDLTKQADEIKKTKAKALSFERLKKEFRHSFDKMLELIKNDKLNEITKKQKENDRTSEKQIRTLNE